MCAVRLILDLLPKAPCASRPCSMGMLRMTWWGTSRRRSANKNLKVRIPAPLAGLGEMLPWWLTDAPQARRARGVTMIGKRLTPLPLGKIGGKIDPMASRSSVSVQARFHTVGRPRRL